MNTEFVSNIELPSGFLPLDICDVQLNVGGRLPWGGIANEDGSVFRFNVHHSDAITFIPPLPSGLDRWDVEWIFGAIHQMLESKRARRAACRAELSAWERRRRRARKLVVATQGANR